MSLLGDLVGVIKAVPGLDTGRKVYRDLIPPDVSPPFVRLVRIGRGHSLRGDDSDITLQETIQVDLFELDPDDDLFDALYAALSDAVTSGMPARLDHSAHLFDVDSGLSQDTFTLTIDFTA